MREDRLRRLAERFDRLAEEDDWRIEQARAVDLTRRAGAQELYALCSHFVTEINRLVTRIRFELVPEEFPPEAFRDGSVNLIQINARGRLVQIAFEATEQLISTDLYRTPYILQGSVRWYNQELLESSGIEEEMLFYCMDGKSGSEWRFYNQRTHRSGRFDIDHLIQLMERL
jgi:hypothetical protein